MFNVCDYWFSKDPGRVRVLRPDTLGQILSYANVQSSSRVLIVDDSGGLIIAAVLERLGGKMGLLFLIDLFLRSIMQQGKGVLWLYLTAPKHLLIHVCRR